MKGKYLVPVLFLVVAIFLFVVDDGMDRSSEVDSSVIWNRGSRFSPDNSGKPTGFYLNDGYPDAVLYPRVSITDSFRLTKEFPVASELFDPMSLTGLRVYNTGENSVFPSGAYVWTGESWESLHPPKEEKIIFDRFSDDFTLFLSDRLYASNPVLPEKDPLRVSTSMQDITVSNAFDPNVLLMSGYLSRMKNQTVQPDISDALSIASANTESESFGSFFYSLPDSMFVYETYMIECSGYSLVDYDTGIDINSQTMIIGGMSVIPDKPTVGAESIKKDVYGTQDCRAVRDTVSGTWHLLVGMEGVLPYEQLKITRVLSCFLIGNEYVTILPDQFADLQGMSRGSAAGIPEGLY